MEADVLKVKLDDAERKALGYDLYRWIEAGITEQGALPERWEQLEKDYSTQPSAGGVELVPGQIPRCLNITQPRVDQLVASVCGPMTAAQPYFVGKAYGQDESNVKVCENTVYFLMRVAEFERRLRMATRVTCMAEPSMFRFMLRDEDSDETEIDIGAGHVLPKLEVIHPKDFVLYPAVTHEIRRAILVGHRFFHTVEEIEDEQAKGNYLDAEIAPLGENPQDDEVGRRKDWSMTEETAGITVPGHQSIRCYEVIFKAKLGQEKKRRYYRAILAHQQKTVLLIELYPYSQPWYFEHFLHEEYGAFYRANPVAQNLQQLQAAYNDAMNLMIDGSIISAFPAGFTNNRMLQKEFVKYEPGTVYQVDGPPEIHWTKPDFDAKELPQLIEKIEELADGAIRVSQAGMGQEFRAGMTATEAQGILAGQQAGLDEYRANASMSGVRLCDFIRELAFLHHSELSKTFGDAYPCKDANALAQPLMWEASGKTSENLPQTVINKLQALMQFVGPLLAGGANGEPGPLQQAGYSINLPELLKVYIDSLKLPVSTDKILQSPQGQGIPDGNPEQLNHILQLIGMGPPQGGAPDVSGGMPPTNGAASMPARPVTTLEAAGPA